MTLDVTDVIAIQTRKQEHFVTHNIFIYITDVNTRHQSFFNFWSQNEGTDQ